MEQGRRGLMFAVAIIELACVYLAFDISYYVLPFM